LPRSLSLFICENIHSVSQLEVLLLLRERGGEWSPRSVAEELRLTNDSAALRLHELHVRVLLRKAPAMHTYSYSPETVQQRSSVDELATCYAAMRHTVITAIFSVPGDSAWALARAFRFRRD